MTKNTNSFLKERTYFCHDLLIRAGEVINHEHFVHAFSKDAPPIGWHLWHMARFADRLRSKLATVSTGSEEAEIWYREDICTKWNLSPDNLGVFESGMGQTHEHAHATVFQAGPIAIIDYAKDVFESCDKHVAKLRDSDFEKTYHGILDYSYDPTTGEVWATEPKVSIVAQDLIFHTTHGSRHMGMMEALRGLLGTAGTLSV